MVISDATQTPYLAKGNDVAGLKYLLPLLYDCSEVGRVSQALLSDLLVRDYPIHRLSALCSFEFNRYYKKL